MPFNEKCKICLRAFTNEIKFADDQSRHKQQFTNLNGEIQCPSNNCGMTIATKVKPQMIHNAIYQPFDNPVYY